MLKSHSKSHQHTLKQIKNLYYKPLNRKKYNHNTHTHKIKKKEVVKMSHTYTKKETRKNESWIDRLEKVFLEYLVIHNMGKW